MNSTAGTSLPSTTLGTLCRSTARQCGKVSEVGRCKTITRGLVGQRTPYAPSVGGRTRKKRMITGSVYERQQTVYHVTVGRRLVVSL